MRPLSRVLLVLAAVIGLTTSEARIVEFSYTEVARGIWADFERIGKHHGLSAEDSLSTQRDAALWYYVWPCKGNMRDFEKSVQGLSLDIQGLSLLTSEARIDRPRVAAFLHMIAILTVSDHGRPSEGSVICRFALETAQPMRPSR
jgi:hypothetical protein